MVVDLSDLEGQTGREQDWPRLQERKTNGLEGHGMDDRSRKGRLENSRGKIG